jgi:hypothetical protein
MFYSNTQKNTQLDATINPKLYCFVVQTLLNMFRALECPSSGARQTAAAASGFRMNVEVEVYSAVVGLLVVCLLTNKPTTADNPLNSIFIKDSSLPFWFSKFPCSRIG